VIDTTTRTDALPDSAIIRAAVDILIPPGGVTELRVLNAGREQTISGYYDDRDRLVADAVALNRKYGTVYMLLNRPPASVLARRVNRYESYVKQATSDAEIDRRWWFLIDQDAIRPAGISATDTEHAAAIERTHAIGGFLAEAGWPEPVVADSGNGGHLLYRIDLPNDDASKALLERCLKALDLRFSDAAAAIDRTTFNASRLTKLYGTVAGKGDSTPDRPHRLARLLTVPDTIVPVPRELLETLAAELPPDIVPAGGNGHGRFDAGAFDLDRWIAERGLPIVATGAWQQGGRKWVLNPCPWDDAHQNRAAYIVQLANGAIGAGCLHNGCQGKRWADLRALFEPEYRDRREAFQATTATAARPVAVSVARPLLEQAREWPAPPDALVYRGLAGRVVETVTPHTEADPLAVHVGFLTAFGNAAGAHPHMLVGATRHTARIFAAFVGRTSKARKGDSWWPVRAVMSLADREWGFRIASGLSSGEGLIYGVRDPEEKRATNKKTGKLDSVVVDEGVTDKRLLVVEPELARVLKVMSRQGNTLSPVLRDGWDHGDLRSMTKNSPLRATGAHISLIGHVTVEELRRELPDVEMANGLANRWQWYAVRRSRLLPDPAPLDEDALDELSIVVARSLSQARSIGRMQRDASATALWREVYADLSEERDGLAGALLARAEAQVLRLSMIYALLDGSAVITAEHLMAALALWQYAERSVENIFGDATGDPVADAIMATLRRNGELTRTQIRDLFGRHESSARIEHAQHLLLTRGYVRLEERQTGGRPVEVWTAA
jgi:hypothetical protein